jgi:hypothetical protein
LFQFCLSGGPVTLYVTLSSKCNGVGRAIQSVRDVFEMHTADLGGVDSLMRKPIVGRPTGRDLIVPVLLGLPTAVGLHSNLVSSNRGLCFRAAEFCARRQGQDGMRGGPGEVLRLSDFKRLRIQT